jgi:hypothetical protein
MIADITMAAAAGIPAARAEIPNEIATTKPAAANGTAARAPARAVGEERRVATLTRQGSQAGPWRASQVACAGDQLR